METGLAHAHKYLGYLTFILSLACFVMAVVQRKTGSTSAAEKLHKLHRLGFMMVGRVTVVFGIVVLVVKYPSEAWLARWPFWVGLLLWGGIEPIGKRMVSQPLTASPATGSGRPLVGTLLETLILLTATGLMTMARMGKL